MTGLTPATVMAMSYPSQKPELDDQARTPRHARRHGVLKVLNIKHLTYEKTEAVQIYNLESSLFVFTA